ncbi:MAG: CPBP family intramembrane metalloprotease [Clostridiales bacterium]|nr:CPBP family intramembrane metalloprotease [Clostridiales bacterium]
MNNKKYAILSSIYYLSMTLVAIVFVLGYKGIIKNSELSSFLIQIVTMLAVPMLLHSLFVSKNFKKTLCDTGFKQISSKMWLISIGLGVVLFLLNGFIADFFSTIIHLFGYERLSNPESVKMTHGLLLKEYLFSAIFPAFCEEFLHRGIMLFSGKKYKSPKLCLIISSLLFGFMHMNINQFFYATILGFLIGYVGLCANSIWPCIVIHFTNNFLSSYFYYGQELGFIIPKLVAKFEVFIQNNLLSFIAYNIITVTLCVYAFNYLIKQMRINRAKTEMTKVVKDLNMENLPIAQAQDKLQHINYILSKSDIKSVFNGCTDNKLTPTEKTVIIGVFTLGILATIASFIWGIM